MSKAIATILSFIAGLFSLVLGIYDMSWPPHDTPQVVYVLKILFGVAFLVAGFVIWPDLSHSTAE